MSPLLLAPLYAVRDRRFRELSDEERDRLRLASEAIAAARVQAKEDAAKAAKKGGKKGGAKPKKAPKGTTAAAASTPAPEEDTEGDTEVEPPSVLEVYDAIREEVIQHISARKEEIARRRAEEKLVPRDPTGEAVMEEVRAQDGAQGRWGEGLPGDATRRLQSGLLEA